MRIGKRYEFSASHRLPNHNGKCRRQHGHNYMLEVEVEGITKQEPGASDEGMVMDFAKLDAVVDSLIEQLDHHDINQDIPAFKVGYPPTAENIVMWVVDNLRLFNKEINFSRIRLWETNKCYAEWISG